MAEVTYKKNVEVRCVAKQRCRHSLPLMAVPFCRFVNVIPDRWNDNTRIIVVAFRG